MQCGDSKCTLREYSDCHLRVAFATSRIFPLSWYIHLNSPSTAKINRSCTPRKSIRIRFRTISILNLVCPINIKCYILFCSGMNETVAGRRRKPILVSTIRQIIQTYLLKYICVYHLWAALLYHMVPGTFPVTTKNERLSNYSCRLYQKVND